MESGPYTALLRARNSSPDSTSANIVRDRSRRTDTGLSATRRNRSIWKTARFPRRALESSNNTRAQWGRLPLQTLAITPIPGYFGQGFPGLIYLSETAYVSARERPADVRNARGETFFGDVLLPHELAHQWWGNLVSAASYRSDWLMESMANYSALQLMESHKGEPALNALLDEYKRDLGAKMQNGATLESAGPVDFGARLLDSYGQQAWLAVEYEKGTWILHMLRERLGTARFHDMQTALLKRYAGKAIDNEEFREAVSEFIPAGQPDPKLTSFFETWVYGTGVPAVEKKRTSIRVSQVADDFTFDMPLTCESGSGTAQTRWVHLTQGDNQISSAMGNCQLPDPSQFLYTPHESKP